MPFIIILTGHPSSGKSTLANKICERALLNQHQSIEKVVIVDELLANSTVSNIAEIAQICYESSAAEKVMRGALKSAFDRAVASAVHDEKEQNKKKTLIILDSTNYIKGYRYELYCICKAATSSYCVVWCLNDISTVKEWNSLRRKALPDPSSGYYSDDILDALILRYEPPDDRNRWDQPLYRIDLRTAEQVERQKNQNQGAGLAEQLLHQSLYNMHNLSDAIATGSPPELSNDTTKAPSTTVEDSVTSVDEAIVPKKRASSTFKRSAFQKKAATPSGSATATTKTMTLTAEALSSFSGTLSSKEPSDATAAAATTSNIGTVRKHNNPRSNKEQQQHIGHRTLDEQVDDFLLQFIQNVQPLKEGTSTRQHRSVESDVLHVVDTITQQLCTVIIDIVGTTEVDNKSANRIEIPLNNKVWYLDCGTMNAERMRELLTLETLRDIRTKYVQWIRKNPIEELESGMGNSNKVIIESFLSYIATQIQQQQQ
jgi:protein KTI12